MDETRVRLGCSLLVVLLLAPAARAQIGAPATGPTPAAPTPAGPPKDTLGRDTPRGTVLGFMAAVRTGSKEAAPLYLNTTQRGKAAADLAQELYVVLDSRLPARLNELSDRLEGSLANPLKPDQDIVGTINTASGPMDVIVERVNRGALGSVWLFSRKTLDLVPAVYDEIDVVSVDQHLPDFLTKPRIGHVRLFEWLVFFLAIPLAYRLVGVLGRLLGRAAALIGRRHATAPWPSDLLPGPVRLLILVVGIRWFLSSFDLPLVERQFWSATSTLLLTSGVVWLLLLLNAGGEPYVRRRLQGSSAREVVAMLRLVRRLADVLVILAGGLVMLRYFGFDPTAALAGLGIGGIAVALAAQKTLENVIGGLSIIFDKAVQVGDSLKLGETMGTVDYIGLRSTRIRTLDRTILSVPNGQIANMNIETMSGRDKFWFHHVVGLRRDTTSDQMRAGVDDIRSFLACHPMVDHVEPIRVRFFRLGPSSLDVEIHAYIFASDWDVFLETQQELLLGVMESVERAGAGIALPSQTLHFIGEPLPALVTRSAESRRAVRGGAAHKSAGTA